jgi:hypothetical protein
MELGMTSNYIPVRLRDIGGRMADAWLSPGSTDPAWSGKDFAILAMAVRRVSCLILTFTSLIRCFDLLTESEVWASR